ncbi:hypothetical protein HHI36_022088 [Cryptolaemus montrouzieri]|uniref:Uncharacterized protein n=1 Tax=Cryptolaemus montrouzieri TaxID=559131 RepID=A0ABD2MYV0_9CUCU
MRAEVFVVILLTLLSAYSANGIQGECLKYVKMYQQLFLNRYPNLELPKLSEILHQNPEILTPVPPYYPNRPSYNPNPGSLGPNQRPPSNYNPGSPSGPNQKPSFNPNLGSGFDASARPPSNSEKPMVYVDPDCNGDICIYI